MTEANQASATAGDDPTSSDIPLEQSDVLRELLAPHDPLEFIAAHWEQKSAHLPHSARVSSSLMRHAADTRELLLRALESPDGERIGLLGFRAEDFPASKRILPTEVRSFVESGGTIYFMEIQQGIPALARLANRLKVLLDYPGPIANDGFWSARGFGLDLHYDLTSTFTLQLEGSKRWRVGLRPAVPYPKDRAFAHKGQCFTVTGTRLPTPSPSDFMEVVLQPGDVLYVPAGTWHEAKGVEESFAITFKLPALDVWEHLVLPVLKTLLPDTPGWRFAPPGIVGPAVAEYLEARRADVVAALQHLTAGAPALQAAWAAAVAQDQAIFRSVKGAGPVASLSPTEELAVSRSHVLTMDVHRAASGAEGVVLFQGATRLHLAVELEPFARKLSTAKRFTVREAMAWGGDGLKEHVHEALLKLLRLGMLERAQAEQRPQQELTSTKRALLSKWLKEGSR